MAIVAMVNHTALEKEIMNITPICPGQDIAPEGMTLPCMVVMTSRWAPPNERSILSAIVYAGSLVPAFSLGALGFIECNYTAGISLMSLCVAALGMGWVGLLPNHIDLSPNFGGHLIAISTTVSSIPGIMMPLVIGELTKKQNTLAQWSIAFDIVACLLLIMCIVYTMYGSGEIQPWNTPKPKAPIPASSQELGLQHF
ncbi:uncharacterized protein GBIM_01647 [Gryllus bimaculatus]|nr:uncharacterized protein GBIM_01647 [Gryllus bimaculatus]